MRAVDALKPLGVFVAVLLVVVAGTAVVASLSGSDGGAPTDGEAIQGQAPSQYQPDAVLAESDPERGDLSVDADADSKRILVDTRHANGYDAHDIQVLVETLVEHGHRVDVENVAAPDDGGFGQSGYSNATLQRYDAYVSVAPTTTYTTREVSALEAFAEGGGRVLLLGEPTQFGGGALSSASSTRASGDELAAAFGVRVGADSLYNLADDANDNNYESIYATPTGDSELTAGVDRVQLDTAGYLVRVEDSDAEVVVETVPGTRTLDRGRAGQYPVVARNGNFVLVADASIIDRSELYDVDNEQFVSNLLTFLVTGDKEEGVPQTSETPGGPGSP